MALVVLAVFLAVSGLSAWLAVKIGERL